MRKQFREFYNEEEIDLKNLNEDTLVVVDANVLLHVFRFSEDSREKLIRALKVVEKNLWTPYQAALEFNMNRIKVVEDHLKYDKNIEEELAAVFEKSKKELKKKVGNTLGDLGVRSSDKNKIKEDMVESIEKLYNEMEKSWKSSETKKIKEFSGVIQKDCPELIEVLDGKVGEQLTQKEIDRIEKEGEQRYKLGFPPGYEDDEKPKKRYGNIEYESKFGDLIIWKEIIKNTKANEIKKVVFISDDDKEDWMYKFDGKTKGPRAELKKEMLVETGADLFLINTNSFLQQAIDENRDIIEFIEPYSLDKRPDYTYQSRAIREDWINAVQEKNNKGTVSNKIKMLDRRIKLELEEVDYLIDYKLERGGENGKMEELELIQKEYRELYRSTMELQLFIDSDQFENPLSKSFVQEKIIFIRAELHRLNSKLNSLKYKME